MKIYDCFIFHNEIQLLKLRVDLLREHVDYFVVCEGLQTFRGDSKPRNFPENIDVAPAELRYIRASLPDYGAGDLAASQRENYQRDLLLWGLEDSASNDLILFGDADEIPDPRALPAIAEAALHGPVKLQQYLSYYAPYYRSAEWWYGTTAAYRHQFKTMVALRNRTIQNTPFVPQAGWHMSYNGDIAFIQDKLRSFAHADMVAGANTVENIEWAINNNVDPFGRGELFTYTPFDTTFPPNLKDFI